MPATPAKLKASRGLEARMMQEHLDVLQNIEFVFVTEAREDGEIDDSVIAKALKTAITGTETEDPVVADVVEALADLRDMRDDISDELWNDGLRVVYTSVRRHSTCRPGDYDYLRFASQFIV